MADASVHQQQPYGAPAAAPAYTAQPKEQYIQQTPVWVVVVRALQVLFGFVVLAMAAYLIHGHAMSANGFAVVCGLFTWIVVGYVLITEKVSSAHGAYNIWAVLSLDFLMALFWLASLGANAAQRASFNQRVTVHGCYDDGSAISAHSCDVSVKRDGVVSKRAAVADEGGLALMSAVAGVSALVWLLFVATLVFHGHTFRLWHQANKTPSADNATVEMKAQGTPMLAPQTTGGTVPQYSDQQQYHSQYAAQGQQPQVYPQQPAAYPQQQQQQQPLPYQPTGTPVQHYPAYPDPNQQQYNQQAQQPAYSPHGTPAPGQPYYPPAQ